MAEIKLDGMNIIAPILIPAFILFFLAFRFISGPRNNIARRIRIKNASLIFQAMTWLCLALGNLLVSGVPVWLAVSDSR